jgi:hypothetical protein
VVDLSPTRKPASAGFFMPKFQSSGFCAGGGVAGVESLINLFVQKTKSVNLFFVHILIFVN